MHSIMSGDEKASVEKLQREEDGDDVGPRGRTFPIGDSPRQLDEPQRVDEEGSPASNYNTSDKYTRKVRARRPV